MNHLNVFHAYKDKAAHHEDELTRSFLVLVKNIPSVQSMFLNMILDAKSLINTLSVDASKLAVEHVYTQISNKNRIFHTDISNDRTLVSVVISDDHFEDNHEVENSERGAVYDGVLLCSPNLLFIIENKPYSKSIWKNQLNPSIQKKNLLTIHSLPSVLSWREIISNLNNIISSKKLTDTEKWIVEDFLEFVDHTHPMINPYTLFDVCKNNKALLDKRCTLALSRIEVNGALKNALYHRGWKHYIESDKRTIKKISIDSTVENNDWTIDLWLVAGDSMNSAKETFRKLDISKLKRLEESGFELLNNFHVSYRSSNLLWFSGTLSIHNYLQYWKDNYLDLRQIKRDEFESYFNLLERKGLTLPSDRQAINDRILLKKFNNLNICPSFLIKYTWSKAEALALDTSASFEKDLRDKLKIAFDVFGESI